MPHGDIRKGNLDESVFAADLSDVIAGRGPLEYRDAGTFFRKTYPTQGLINLLSAVLGRLSGAGSGEPVIQIQTPFGGGKTHSLIALYHLFNSFNEIKGNEAVQEILDKARVDKMPTVKVSAFIGTAADPLKGRTPWGELGEQLGKYELIKEHDKKRRAPGKDLLHRIIGDEPTLILMDEIAEYAVKGKDFSDQIVAFYQELTETVKVSPRCALVVTLPSSAPYGEAGERALHELQQVFKRVESIKTPVEGEEIYEVIRRRLFEDPGDPQEVRSVADKFLEMYQRLGDDVPKETREPAYRERIRKSYPFHPELIDVLFERWSTFPDFQRTRGVLRLLAQIVSELYKNKHKSQLILPSHINIANPSIRGEFLRHIGNEYQGVIAADIAGPNAAAERLDREMGSEYARFAVGSGLARAIFFCSFSGSEKRGVGIQRLRLAVLEPGMPTAIIGDALKRLEDQLWYLHSENGIYQFSNRPNINRIIVEKEEAVKPEEIIEEIRFRLEKLAGTEMKIYLWPQVAQDIPDTKELKVGILSLENTRRSGSIETVVSEFLDKSGQTFRVYKNTLFLIVADDGELPALKHKIKQLLACRAIQNDKTIMHQLTQENKKWLETRIRDLDSGIVHQLLSAYRHVARAKENGVQWLYIGLPSVAEKPSLTNRVKEYLQCEDILLNKIQPNRIIQKVFKDDEKEKSIGEIYDAYLKYPVLPVLENKQVLINALIQGVEQGVFGLRIGESVYFKERVPSSQIDDGVVVLREVEKEPPGPVPPLPPPQVAGVITAEDILWAAKSLMVLKEVSEYELKVLYDKLREERRNEISDENEFNKKFRDALKDGVERKIFEIVPSEIIDSPDFDNLLNNARLKIISQKGPEPKIIRCYKLHAVLRYDKLSDFVRGVVMPLKADGADISVEVFVEAQAKDGIKKPTIEQKVRETLKQIGAEIKEETLS